MADESDEANTAGTYVKSLVFGGLDGIITTFAIARRPRRRLASQHAGGRGRAGCPSSKKTRAGGDGRGRARASGSRPFDGRRELDRRRAVHGHRRLSVGARRGRVIPGSRRRSRDVRFGLEVRSVGRVCRRARARQEANAPQVRRVGAPPRARGAEGRRPSREDAPLTARVRAAEWKMPPRC